MMWILWIVLYMIVGFVVSMKIHLSDYDKILLGDLFTIFVFTVLWPIFLLILVILKLSDIKDIVIFDFSKKVKK